jgi:hypothetical protein
MNSVQVKHLQAFKSYASVGPGRKKRRAPSRLSATSVGSISFVLVPAHLETLPDWSFWKKGIKFRQNFQKI